MHGWSTALRMARREARRAKGRSALVIALIALPVFGLSFVAVAYDSFRLTEEQQIDRDIGAADAQLAWRFQSSAYQTPDLMVQGAEPGTPLREQPPTADEVREVLPPGSHVVPRRTETLRMRTATGHGDLHAEWLDLDDPIHLPRVVLREGRAPVGDGEVALTRRGADRLGAGIGDEVATADGEQGWTVVGIAEFPYRFAAAVLLPADPAAAETWLVSTPEPVTWEQVRELNEHGIFVRSRHVLLNPPPPSQVDADDHVTWSPDDTGQQIALGTLLVGMATLEVVLLAGPAFAVSARRRQRQLALVAAQGGTSAHLRRIVLADGIVLGAAGAVVGVAVGVAAALAAVPLLEEHLLNRRISATRVFPLALLGVAVLAVVTGLLAAVVPAVTAARQQVVSALSGRRGQVRSRTRWLVVGLVTAGLGAGLATAGAWQVATGAMVAGLVIAQLGLVLCTPALVGLVARLGRLLPLAPRMALRDTGRHRAAAAPAVAAVMAAVAGALTLGIYVAAGDQRSHDSHQAGLPVGHVVVPYEVWGDDGPEVLTADQQEQVRAAMVDALPVTGIHEVTVAACRQGAGADGCRVRVPVAEPHRCPAEDLRAERLAARSAAGGEFAFSSLLTDEEQRQARTDPRCQEPERFSYVHLGFAVIDDGSALPALTGGDRGDLAAARAALAAGGVVVTDERKVVDGRTTLEIIDYADERERVREITVPAYALTSGEDVGFVVLPTGALDQVDLGAQPYGLVAATAAVPTQAQEDALRASLSGIHTDLGRQAQVARGPSDRQDPLLLVLTAVAGVVALAAAGIATGLAAADRRGDLATLGAVGASPRVRRWLATSQAGTIAGLGALLGTAAGVGSAAAVLAGLNRAEAHVWPPPAPPYELAIPWPVLVLLLVVVPAVAMAGAGLLTRSRLPAERRRLT
jgi:putative ABC transport system permease protein